MRPRTVEFLLEMPDRIHRIKYFTARMARSGLGQRRYKARMIRASQRDHGVAVRVRSHAASMLVRRTPRGNEMNFVEVESAFGGARHGQMSDVDGIECAAKKRDAARA